jgi:hypothetical protein
VTLLWTGSSETSGPLSPPLTITATQAQQGFNLYWRCLPSPDGVSTSMSVSISQGGQQFAWVGNVVQCGASGANYINTLHGGAFQVSVTAASAWTVRVLARKP